MNDSIRLQIIKYEYSFVSSFFMFSLLKNKMVIKTAIEKEHIGKKVLDNSDNIYSPTLMLSYHKLFGM